MRRTAAVLALALAACGGAHDASQARSSTATTDAPSTTTTTLANPDQAFIDDLHAFVEFDDNPEWGQRALGLARSTCDLLDGVDVMADADAPNDTPETDASIVAQMTNMGLSQIYTSAATTETHDVAAVLLVGAQHFCPEHLDVISADATARGVAL